MEWKDVLKGLMEKHQITAAELSRRSKVSQGNISRYLSGERENPAFGHLLKIADALGEPVPGGTATVSAQAKRDPEAEEFVREWQGLPDEGRILTREFVRILGEWSSKKKRKPQPPIPRFEAVYGRRDLEEA